MVTTVPVVLLWYLKLKHIKQDTYNAFYHSNCGFTVIFEVKTQARHFTMLLPQ